ncbi:hypothetical protein M23134_07871 [Microscilla marina ATCC 23134]|uniref:Uncharacterized protein n=1 Tax=Microscilla marina ATCC 23134 TaxID=313606 RepID=A1ZLL9_MICM2|nr:hypothetical protein M23134_07871 [Microscilla marina ATCC 23134]
MICTCFSGYIQRDNWGKFRQKTGDSPKLSHNSAHIKQ